MSGENQRVDPATVLGPAAGVASVEIGEEIVVYRVDRPASFVLNATAGLLWQCLDRTSTLADIFDDIAVAFGADRRAVEADCLDVLDAWLFQELVEEVTDD